MSSAASDDDEVLEKMLMAAQRLALQMRCSTGTGLGEPHDHRLSDASSDHAGSFLSESDHLDHNYPHIVSCDSNHSIGEHESSLNSYFEKINLQESHESRESNGSCEEQKSSASVASAQQDAIAEAIKATREMEQTLRALAESPSAGQPPFKGPPPSSGRLGDTQNVASSYGRPSQAATAEGNLRVDAELNNSSTHISWEKVEPIREEDADFVRVLDYSSPRKVPFPRDDSEIKWERINSPDKDEDDYTPISDYTYTSSRHSVNRSPMQLIRGAILPNHKHRRARGTPMPLQLSSRAARRRRRRALRALALVLSLGAFLFWVFFAPEDPSVAEPTVVEEAWHLVVPDGEPSVEDVAVEGHSSNEELVEALKDEDALPANVVSSTSRFEEAMLPTREEKNDICFGLSNDELVAVETEKDVVPEPPVEEEAEAGPDPDLDSAKEELICLFGGRCLADVKERKLFTRDNLELLLASLMP
jgi:hypothetical protein